MARSATSATTGWKAARAVGYVLAALFSFVAGHSARDLGADWLLTSLAGAGGYSAATATARWSARLVSPRRFRV